MSLKMPAMDPRIFLAVALSGDQQHPNVPSCVWINASTGSAKHTLIEKVNPKELRDGLLKMQIDSPDKYLFVNQDGKNVHVFTHSKRDASASFAKALANSESGS